MPPLEKLFPAAIIGLILAAAVHGVNEYALGEKLSRPLYVIAILLAVYAPFYFDKSEYTHGVRYWHNAAEYFRPKILSLYGSMGLDPTVVLKHPSAFRSCTQAIFCSHPHGVMSYHHALFYVHASGAEELIRAIPLEKRRALGARSLFGIPFFRDFVLMAGAVDASAPVASRCLARGLSLTILPGGEREQLLAEKDKHVVFVKTRKGFCKLAVKHNVPIVPAYCFGETSAFTTSSFLLPQREWLAKQFFVAIPLAWGGSSWNPFAPLRSPLTHCIGPPIAVPPADASLDAEADVRRRVDLMHSQYVDAIRALFEDNKAACGHPEAELLVL